MAEPITEGPVALRKSPLSHLQERMDAAAVRGAPGVTLTELPFVTMVNVRVDPASAAAERIGGPLAAPLPRRCGDTAAPGLHTIMWLGPDEWLVLSRDDAGTVTAQGRAAPLRAPPPA